MPGQNRVPYMPDMNLGQGFNSYLQECRQSDVVNIKTTSGPVPQLEIFYDSEEISTYEKLVETLDISAGAGLSHGQQDGHIDTEYLDKTETLIRIKGVFKVYQANVPVSAEIGKTMQQIANRCQIITKLHYIGASPEQQENSEVENDEYRLKWLNEVADNFYKKSQKHEYKRFALLGKYTTFDIPKEFKPFDYEYAMKASWGVFNAFAEYLAIEDLIKHAITMLH
ncbi:hypothetical protein N7471_009144 [Penicillium samsonianum]|uniref:uncharacterized protein n=1 Tax=Penicillium samsonianum TaxID=1882272 RepID=UPI0025490553|nr:uncharacterized protein N7471_009144 [Penicillium samsonianum]KAJ6127927.1 hypothetical protein N7471_009144 [Penicillium samsonianum]